MAAVNWSNSGRTKNAPTPSLRVEPLALTLAFFYSTFLKIKSRLSKLNVPQRFRFLHDEENLRKPSGNPPGQLWRAKAHVEIVRYLWKRAESTLWSYLTTVYGKCLNIPVTFCQKIQTCDLVLSSRYQETCSDDNILESKRMTFATTENIVQLQIFLLYFSEGCIRNGKRLP